jgi:hypothetical protein
MLKEPPIVARRLASGDWVYEITFPAPPSLRALYGVEYQAYANAKARCSNPNHPQWPDYGERGIQFLFESFEQFLDHVGPRPRGLTLDRIDNDSHYMIGNVRWATWDEQARNRRPRRKTERK